MLVVIQFLFSERAHLILLGKLLVILKIMLKMLSMTIQGSYPILFTLNQCSDTIQNDLATFKLLITKDSANNLEICLLFTEICMICFTQGGLYLMFCLNIFSFFLFFERKDTESSVKLLQQTNLDVNSKNLRVQVLLQKVLSVNLCKQSSVPIN